MNSTIFFFCQNCPIFIHTPSLFNGLKYITLASSHARYILQYAPINFKTTKTSCIMAIKSFRKK